MRLPAALDILPALGVALLCCLALGRLGPRLRVPRVTLYLLVGMALGPHGLLRFLDGPTAEAVLLGPQTAAPLRALEQLAACFIVFGIGSEFRLPVLRRVGPRVRWVAGAEVLATGALVGAAVWLATGDAGLAVVAPALAVSTAPSATLVTLREVAAEGPASRATILCAGLDNLAALLLFPALLAIGLGTGMPLAAIGTAGLALAAGAAIGLAAAVALEVMERPAEQVMLGLVAVLATLACEPLFAAAAPGTALLAAFGAGVAVANASPHSEGFLERVQAAAYPLYVLFFLASGRELHVEALAAVGGLGVLFVGARALGKLGGAWIGLRLAGWQHELPRSFGSGLLSQAGVALALATALEQAAPGRSAELRQVVLTSVVIFELAGPLLLRRMVVSAGEVKLANLVPHSEVSGPEAFRWVWTEMLRNLGIVRGTGDARGAEATVRDVMRRRPEVLPAEAPFSRVLHALAEPGSGDLPVVDAEGRLVGVISYDEVKSTFYDPGLRALLIAADLSVEVPDPLHPGDSLAHALELIDRRGATSWPVVEEERLVGSVRRADVYGLLHRSLSAPPGARGAAEG